MLENSRTFENYVVCVKTNFNQILHARGRKTHLWLTVALYTKNDVSKKEFSSTVRESLHGTYFAMTDFLGLPLQML